MEDNENFDADNISFYDLVTKVLGMNFPFEKFDSSIKEGTINEKGDME